MPRAGLAKKAVRRARIFAITKGFIGRSNNCYTIAVRAAEKAMQNMYIGRKLKKRDMRKLWVQRISIANRELGSNYSQFMSGLVKADVALNRKVGITPAGCPLDLNSLCRIVAPLNARESIACNAQLLY